MPVLIVSEKTWPHDGFSRKRSMRPSSSVTTIPNSSGLSTDLSPIVTARALLLVRPQHRRQVDVAERVAGDDEERAPRARRVASRTEPAVPSGVSSTEYEMFRPSDSPSPK